MKSDSRLSATLFGRLAPAALFAALLLPQAHAQGGGGVGTGRPGDRGQPQDPAAAKEADYTVPFNVKEVTKKAVLLSRPEPGFTREARENQTEGVVRLRAVLGADGKVSNIVVVKGLPDGLTEKAIAAARRIEFTPAQKDGRNVSQWVTIEYNFNIYYDEDDEVVTRKAVILERPEPQYTEEARAAKAEGRVVLRVVLPKSGEASVAGVIVGLPHGLTERAVEAAKLIKFKPAEAGGRPVSVIREIEYVFSLK